MFRLRRTAPEVAWKSIEDDFVLGVCSRRVFGYATRDVDGRWVAFNSDAQVIGAFVRLTDAEAALWRTHHDEHDTVCAQGANDRSARHSAALRQTSATSQPEGASGITPRATVRPGSW